MRKPHRARCGNREEKRQPYRWCCPTFWVHKVPENVFVSSYEAFKALRRLKTNKAPGPDCIPSLILKMFAFELSPILAELYNTSIKQGFLPSLLKSAVICPLPKRRPPKSIECDVRPISLTSHTAKIMEGFTLSRVLPGITERLDPKQFTMTAKATQHPIVYHLHLTLEAVDHGNCWARWFFADFKKGFDLVDHRILLDKLKLLEVHPCLLRWIASFLEGRSQVVWIASSYWPPCKLNGSIHQGTRLGPLLFAVMVNGLIRHWLPRAKFVDDLTIIEMIPRDVPSILPGADVQLPY